MSLVVSSQMNRGKKLQFAILTWIILVGLFIGLGSIALFIWDFRTDQANERRREHLMQAVHVIESIPPENRTVEKVTSIINNVSSELKIWHTRHKPEITIGYGIEPLGPIHVYYVSTGEYGYEE